MDDNTKWSKYEVTERDAELAIPVYLFEKKPINLCGNLTQFFSLHMAGFTTKIKSVSLMKACQSTIELKS
jgi:hypothetical protein